MSVEQPALPRAGERDRLLADAQGSFRRLAALVGAGSPADQLFEAVVGELTRVLGVPSAVLARYEPDRSLSVLASVDAPHFPTGRRTPLDEHGVAAAVLDSGRPAASGDRSSVGVPVLRGARVWGVATVAASPGEALPAGTEERLDYVTRLVAIAISNAEARDRLHGLADEQAALQRVATLVAEGRTTAELGQGVLEEVLRVLDVPAGWLVRYEPDSSITVLASLNDPLFPPGTRWPLDGSSLSALLLETGRPGRIDDYSELEGTLAARTRDSGYLSVAGVPIAVEGKVWGLICVGTKDPRTLPPDTEARLEGFTELVATAISNAESGDRLRRLADDQAALRRVATLVAEGASPASLFTAVAEEVARIVDVSSVSVVQFDSETSSVVVASLDDPGFEAGSRWPLEGPSLNATVFATGGPARIDHADLPGAVAAAARASGVGSGVAVPIVVDGKVWGMVAVGRRNRPEPLPPETEPRLAAFTDLVGTAISKAVAHDELRRLADEQAALRRVAILVAEAAPPAVTFAAVAEEVARLFDLPWVGVMQYDAADSFTVVATWGDHPFPAGSRWPLDGPSTFEAVLRTGRPARIDDYSGLPGTVAEAAGRAGIVGGIGAPIVVDGTTWGVVAAPATAERAIPEGAEIRLSLFTELIATAVSNLEAHQDLSDLAEEQSALRRVATLVAEGVPPEELFLGVASEVARVLGVSAAVLDRYEPDGTAVTVAASHEPGWTAADGLLRPGTVWPPAPHRLTTLVAGTGRAATVHDYSELEGEVGEISRAAGVGAGCAAPIVVDGRLWGSLLVFSRQGTRLPADVEPRLERFSELVATAISNAAARAELVASRTRIVEAGDEIRRRMERNLHDGTQQGLIAIGLEIQQIRGRLPADQAAVDAALERMQDDLESVLEDVREFSRGLHPPLLSRGGLRPALRAFARRSPIPVELEIDLPERPAATLEAAVYYIVAEALTNAVEHSRASTISVTVEMDESAVPSLRATVSDDGVGGAHATEGSGLMGLADRVDALGGRLVLDSPRGRGTTISIVLPLTWAATP